MTFIIPYPAIDPVLIAVGPFAIRWYALAYIAGILAGWRIVLLLARRPPHALTAKDAEDFVVWATIGIVLGGRLGYILFYQPSHYLTHPLQVFEVWHGGMSYHGGMLGVAVALVLFCRQRRLHLLAVADLLAVVAPIGLLFGRLANFVNGELWGRPTDVPWAMVFPTGGPVPRHPSQLYEAGMEGILLGLLMMACWRRDGIRARPGTLTGIFLIGYGCARITGEFFREPDAFLGFLWGGATMGQLLSLPMILAGLLLIRHARRPAS